MTVDRSDTSLARRTKITAEDNRASSVTIGVTGVLLVVTVVVVLVTTDVITIARDTCLRQWRHHKRKFKVGDREFTTVTNVSLSDVESQF